MPSKEGANLYVWVINLYFLTMTAFQPLYGQLANVFGRRYPLIVATAIFTFGSGICGGASTIGMLVFGRGIQGSGAGGVNVLIEIVVCDLVPLRERGNYLAIIFGLIALGAALGPVLSISLPHVVPETEEMFSPLYLAQCGKWYWLVRLRTHQC